MSRATAGLAWPVLSLSRHLPCVGTPRTHTHTHTHVRTQAGSCRDTHAGRQAGRHGAKASSPWTRERTGRTALLSSSLWLRASASASSSPQRNATLRRSHPSAPLYSGRRQRRGHARQTRPNPVRRLSCTLYLVSLYQPQPPCALDRNTKSPASSPLVGHEPRTRFVELGIRLALRAAGRLLRLKGFHPRQHCPHLRQAAAVFIVP